MKWLTPKEIKLDDTSRNRQALTELDIGFVISLTESCLYVKGTKANLKAVSQLKPKHTN